MAPRREKNEKGAERVVRIPFLWSFRRCPYAIRARMALHAAQVNYEIREIALRDKPRAMLAHSSKGTVPILVVPQAEAAPLVIDESVDIMRWALQQNDPTRLLTGDDGAESLWTTWVDLFKPLLDDYKYKKREMTEPQRSVVVSGCHQALAQVEVALSAGFLLGERVSIADIAVFPFVRQFHFVEPKQLEQWNLKTTLTWLQSFLDSEEFACVMQKVPLWSAAEEISNPEANNIGAGNIS